MLDYIIEKDPIINKFLPKDRRKSYFYFDNFAHLI